jgi:amino-acid N-acetyltransferase
MRFAKTMNTARLVALRIVLTFCKFNGLNNNYHHETKHELVCFKCKIYMTIQIKSAELYRDTVVELLIRNHLPVIDLPGILHNFYVAVENDVTCGVAGLEIYDNFGLIRSVAVSADKRSAGIGAALLQKVEEVAASKHLEAIYLLTETAKNYFEKHGYEHIARMDIPDVVKSSAEFTHLCPESAIAMQKSL